jgi:hypothetical protein
MTWRFPPASMMVSRPVRTTPDSMVTSNIAHIIGQIADQRQVSQTLSPFCTVPD